MWTYIPSQLFCTIENSTWVFTYKWTLVTNVACNLQIACEPNHLDDQAQLFWLNIWGVLLSTWKSLLYLCGLLICSNDHNRDWDFTIRWQPCMVGDGIIVALQKAYISWIDLFTEEKPNCEWLLQHNDSTLCSNGTADLEGVIRCAMYFEWMKSAIYNQTIQDITTMCFTSYLYKVYGGCRLGEKMQKGIVYFGK